MHLPVRADSVTGPGNMKSYYFDDFDQKGFLNVTDGQTWIFTVANINTSQLTGNRIFQFFIQDYGAGWEMVTIQVHANYYGPGSYLFQNYDKGWVLKSSQSFPPGSINGKFDLRMQMKYLGTNYQVTPQYRLPGGSWQTFQGGVWSSATYQLTQAYLAMQIDAGSDGTVNYDTPTAHSENSWYVDKTGIVQDAINNAIQGGTVLIYGGTHLESLYINKSITVTGVGNTVINGSGLFTTTYNDTQLTRDAAVFVVNSTNVTLRCLDIEGSGLGPGSSSGVFFIYSTGTITNCTVSPNTSGDMNGMGLEVRGSAIEILQCIVDNFGQTGIYFGNCSGGVCNSTIKGNVYTAFDKENYGIQVDVYRQGPSNLEIQGNEISNFTNTYLPAPSMPSAGIIIDLWRRYDNITGSKVTVQNNRIHDNYEGIEVVPNSGTLVNYNSVCNNTHGETVDQDVLGTNPTLNACCNWWGSSSGPTHYSNGGGTGDAISNLVNYSPWLQNSFETTPRTYDVNPTGTIQEAIDAANSGDTILVNDGTYDEQLTINKNLTIQGTSSSAVIKPSSQTKLTNIFTAPWLTNSRNLAPIIAANVTAPSNVILRNLKIDGSNVATVPSGADFVVGILYLETGGTIDMLNVTNIMQQDSTYGSGIYAASETNRATVEINETSITNFRGNGIESCGGGVNNLNLNIDNNFIYGRGQTGTGDAVQNGILITEGCSATITNNLVSNFNYTNTNGSASGITYFEASGEANENTATNCQTGIAAIAESPGNWNIDLENNDISGSSFSAVHAQVQNINSCINLIISNNNLTLGSGDGINIGLPPNQLPLGNITVNIAENMVTGWTYGVHLLSSIVENSTVGGNTITQNGDTGILIDPSQNASKIIVTYNSITQNSNFGIFNNGSGKIDAGYNWWGDKTGPYHPTLNPLGQGDRVSDNVIFQPWLTQQQGLPVISVQPQSSLFTVGETRDVQLQITNVTQVTGWELKIYYRNDIVNCTGASEGSFLQSGGSTFLVKQINNYYNSTHGRILLACSLLGQNVSVSGSGILASVTFTALANGETTLSLVDTKLSDQRIPPQPIPHNDADGEIQVGTTIEIDPPSSQASAGQVFSINVAINGVANLTGWEFKLFYLNTVLNCTGAIEGPFLNSHGSTFFTQQVNNAYNATHGRLLIACSLLGQDVSVNGSGIATTIFFQAIGAGTTSLHLADTKLSDEELPPQPIPHFDIDGTVSVIGPHDVTVVNAATSKTGCKPMPTIGRGFAAKINVTVGNIGQNTESFNVTVYANSTVIGAASVINLAPGGQQVIIFVWNTSTFTVGNYTITAYAEPVPGEMHVQDNTFNAGITMVTIAGDINGDQIVDIYDAIILAGAFNTVPGNAKWNPNADIDCTGTVDIYDAIILAGHFNQHA